MTETLALRPAETASGLCKVCGAAARAFGAADFNRSCEDGKGAVLPPAGVAVSYLRCTVCGLIFSEAFDDWSPEDFARHIYNDDYVRVDPEYISARPRRGARDISQLFGEAKGEIRLLDYGGGSGLLAETLREEGFDAASFDPFSREHAARPHGRFNLVTCFEVIEHMTDPVAGVADIASFLDEAAVVLFTTLLQPSDIAAIGMRWWYIGPRNGHVTLHSRASLERLWATAGLRTLSLTSNNHVASRRVPAFARPWLSRLPARG